MGAVGNRARDGIEKTFKHADHRRDLARGQSLNQFVGMLFIGGHGSLPSRILHAESGLCEGVDLPPTGPATYSLR
jgi:hypothetical protein